MLVFEERGNQSTRTKPPTLFPESFIFPQEAVVNHSLLWEDERPWKWSCKTSWCRVENQQSQPTGRWIWESNLVHIGGRQVLSPLCHLCTPKASLLTSLFHSSPQDPESNACECSNWRCICGCNNLSKTFGSETKPGIL